MNRIFIRGDTHGNFDFLEKFCYDNKTDLQDYLIILGDAGYFKIRVQCADVALQAFGTVVLVFYY